ncbi:MAG: 50S ribosomal protein L19 [Bacteroidetes bacterium GWE2_29_8]|nr:MAG: 50S ribosomal protein L19 [Bacteroidetes bacterium GWE2_29_8]OFY24368.1 MAG: 50S ribosomal protein L19 [Bacteroidetes bacterium GWF2_29_10]
MDLLKLAESKLIEKKELPLFNSGDTVTVNYRIKEGAKERIQQFQGVVIQRAGAGLTKTFTVRKISSNNIGVERIFPENSPFIESMEINKRGRVRRARIFYLRQLKGKKAKIKEKKTFFQSKKA